MLSTFKVHELGSSSFRKEKMKGNRWKVGCRGVEGGIHVGVCRGTEFPSVQCTAVVGSISSSGAGNGRLDCGHTGISPSLLFPNTFPPRLQYCQSKQSPGNPRAALGIPRNPLRTWESVVAPWTGHRSPQGSSIVRVMILRIDTAWLSCHNTSCPL